MKTFIAFSCALCVANSVLADPYSAAIQQAKNVSAKVTRADQASLSSTAEPPQISPQPNPVLEATLRNIANLRTDFAVLGNLASTNSTATPRQLLMNDLATAAQGAKASPASIARLADDLATATAGKVKTEATQQKLAQNIHAIFNSSHLSPAQQQMIFDNVQKNLQGSGTAPEEATNVVNDIKQIATETR
jgi:poly-gamma-glutamate capsule biosynthesis protein CapA/YwtB (metallophosphatase superfamily)